MIAPERTEYETGDILKHPAETDSIIIILYSDNWNNMQNYDYSKVIKYNFTTGVKEVMLYFSMTEFQPHALRYYNGKLYILGIDYVVEGGNSSLRIYDFESLVLLENINLTASFHFGMWSWSLAVENDDTFYVLINCTYDEWEHRTFVQKVERVGGGWEHTLGFAVEGEDFAAFNVSFVEAGRDGYVYVSLGGNLFTYGQIAMFDSVTGERKGYLYGDPTWDTWPQHLLFTDF